MIGARGCACWNGISCCPSAVTTLLVNVAISGGGALIREPGLCEASMGNTGARAAMGVIGFCRGTPDERPPPRVSCVSQASFLFGSATRVQQECALRLQLHDMSSSSSLFSICSGKVPHI